MRAGLRVKKLPRWGEGVGISAVQEQAAFEAEKFELDDIIDTLRRAIQILSKHASAALLQSQGTEKMVEAQRSSKSFV